MHQSNLLILLRQFEQEEWKTFGKFLHSPYCNSNKRLPVFYDYLSRYYPGFDHLKLERKIIWRTLFDKEVPFNDAILRVLMASMHKAAEQFLVAEQLSSNEILQNRLLAEAYDQHQLYGRFVKITQATLVKLNDRPIKRMEDLLDAFQLNVNLHYHPETEGLTPESMPIQEALCRLDEFYLLAKLRLSVELSARTNLLQETGSYPLLQPLCEYAKTTAVDAATSLYLDLLKINFEGLTADQFFHLKNNFIKNKDQLDRQVQIEVLTHLMNFGNRLSLTDSSLFFKELFELSRIGVDSDLFHQHGLLPDLWFTNIVIIAAVCEEWEWTEAFIREHSSWLAPKNAESTVALANAYLLFHQGKFHQAYDLFTNIPNPDIAYQIRGQSLSLRCLFEMMLEKGDFQEVLQAKIESFDRFLHRQKVFNPERMIAELHFVRILKKMVYNFSEVNDSMSKWRRLQEETQATSPLVLKSWLLEKQELLMKNT